MTRNKKLEDINKELKNLWKEESLGNKNIISPNIFLCRHNGIWYVTMHDNKSVYYFMSLDMNRICTAVRSNCIIKKYNGISIYYIDKFEELQVISCRKCDNTDENEVFLMKVIIPNVTEIKNF